MFNSKAGGNNGAIAEEFMERYLTTTDPASRHFFKVPIRTRQRQIQLNKDAVGSTDRVLNLRRASWSDLLSASGELLRGGINKLDLLVLIVSDDQFGRSVDVHMAECKFGNVWMSLEAHVVDNARWGATLVARILLDLLQTIH